MSESGYIRLGNFHRGMAPDAAPEPGETEVAVDRSNPVLGNRHVLHNANDPAERAQVIAAYRSDLEEDMARGGAMSRAVRDLAERVRRGERLVAMCWCLPRACHAEVIIEQVERLSREFAGFDDICVTT